MRIRVSVQHTLPAPPADVFALAVDPVRFPTMFRGCGPIPALERIVPQGPPAPGGTREVLSGDGSRLTERITAWQPPCRHDYTLTGLRPPLAWLARAGHAAWTFAPAGAGTRVRWRYDWELTGPWAWPLAWPLLQGFLRIAMRRCLRAMAETA